MTRIALLCLLLAGCSTPNPSSACTENGGRVDCHSAGDACVAPAPGMGGCK